MLPYPHYYRALSVYARQYTSDVSASPLVLPCDLRWTFDTAAHARLACGRGPSSRPIFSRSSSPSAR